jgi:hypothetical protein
MISTEPVAGIVTSTFAEITGASPPTFLERAAARVNFSLNREFGCLAQKPTL